MREATDTATVRTAATELLTLLCERYPATFKHANETPVPLAIGISDHLRAALEIDPAILHTALRLYVRRGAYQKCLTRPDAMRIDLAGQPTGPVSPEHQAAATSGQQTATPAAGAPALTWDDVQAITHALATVPPGEAKAMKVTLVGRPGKVETRDQAVLFRMQGKPPGSLPKGLPPTPPTPPMTWSVIVAMRQWNRVQESIETSADDQLIIEGYPVMQGTQAVLMAQSCTSVLQQRQRKEAQKAQTETPPSEDQ